MSATLATANLAAPLRPLAETAALFRQECTALDHLIEELFRDVEQLREELARKGDEIEEGRRVLCWLHGPEELIPEGGHAPLEREEIAVAEEA